MEIQNHQFYVAASKKYMFVPGKDEEIHNMHYVLYCGRGEEGCQDSCTSTVVQSSVGC
jgi:hypothetical protein